MHLRWLVGLYLLLPHDLPKSSSIWGTAHAAQQGLGWGGVAVSCYTFGGLDA
jgi:hypothetical protein